MFRKSLVAAALLGLVLYVVNASWLASSPADGDLTIISHRGIHQTYDRTDLGRDTCTADRIFKPEHAFLENTLASMEAAFAAGADIVELDIHPTTDGHFAVFHDWTLDCRTDGSGVTREHSLSALKALDIGYGYTADNGQTYPFRGTGLGKLPSLSDVLEGFPEGKFLINFKSRDPAEADRLEALLKTHPEWETRVWGVYGGEAPTAKMIRHRPGLRGFTKEDTKSCLLRYIALGWSGFVPGACRSQTILVPSNYAPYLWGWPNRFLARMRAHDTEVIYSGPPKGTGGIDTQEQMQSVPDGFQGYIWTNRIELIGPALSQQN